MIYCFSNSGFSCKIVDDSYVKSNGELLITTENPLDVSVAQLSTAFPTVASKRTFTVTTNGITGERRPVYEYVLSTLSKA